MQELKKESGEMRSTYNIIFAKISFIQMKDKKKSRQLVAACLTLIPMDA